MRYITTNQVISLIQHQGLGPVRDIGLLHSALLRPQSVLYGVESYPTLASKAAALLESMVRNHPLVDGNKRLGWITTVIFLDMNGCRIDVEDDAAVDFVMSVAAGAESFEDITEWLARRL